MHSHILLTAVVVTLFSFIENSRLHYSFSGACSDGYVNTDANCDECGVPNVFPNAKIVGGVIALNQSFPYHVLIVQSFKGKYLLNNAYKNVSTSNLCGGVLINGFTVLTAAQCIKHQFTYYDENKSKYTLNAYPTDYYKDVESTFVVYLGIIDKSYKTVRGYLPTGGEYSTVEKAIRHKMYDDTSHLHDIGILILSKTFSSSYIKPACLPSLNFSYFTYPKENTIVYAAGWGELYAGALVTPGLLQNVKLKVYNESYCSFPQEGFLTDINFQLCVGNNSGFQDTCLADTGGGIYSYDVLGNRSRFIVSGILSYNSSCGKTGLPRAHTRVTPYLDWIQYVIENYEDINTFLNSKSNINRASLSITLMSFVIYLYSKLMKNVWL